MKFHNDAIVLSGKTGTKLKSEIIGSYYPLWWWITSGGASRRFMLPTTIVEMNAGTGEDYIEETKETILGSSGHALKLKASNQNTRDLNLVLVENDPECFSHMLNVINRNWPNLEFSSNVVENNESDVILLRDHIDVINNVDLTIGNSLFFFDPLLYTPWSEIEKIAEQRITSYYIRRTEFIVFLFTSDWFLGRDKLVPLPKSRNESSWNEAEKNSVQKVDDLFGNVGWRNNVLTDVAIESRMKTLVKLYKERLRRWFRYVLPLPFEPKPNQTYHLFMCSNDEEGINITKKFYTDYSKNPKYLPDHISAYKKFVWLHPKKRIRGSARSYEWKVLWRIVRNHEDGLCDKKCTDLIEKVSDVQTLVDSLEWLCSEKYLDKIEHASIPWEKRPQLYQLNWNIVEERLKVKRPVELIPLSKDRPPPAPPKKNNLDQWLE